MKRRNSTPNWCGWLKDKFGLSWQIVPARLPDLIKHPKAMQAMMQMKKIDLAELERAAQSSFALNRKKALHQGKQISQTLIRLYIHLYHCSAFNPRHPRSTPNQ